MILEAEKPQDLQSAGWRPRRVDGVSPNPKDGRLKTQEGPAFQFESKGRKRPMSQLPAVRQGEFTLTLGRASLSVLFRSSPDWMRPIALRRAICFTPSLIQMLICPKPLPDTPRKMSEQTSGCP